MHWPPIATTSTYMTSLGIHTKLCNKIEIRHTQGAKANSSNLLLYQIIEGIHKWSSRSYDSFCELKGDSSIEFREHRLIRCSSNVGIFGIMYVVDAIAFF